MYTVVVSSYNQFRSEIRDLQTRYLKQQKMDKIFATCLFIKQVIQILSPLTFKVHAARQCIWILRIFFFFWFNNILPYHIIEKNGNYYCSILLDIWITNACNAQEKCCWIGYGIEEILTCLGSKFFLIR